MGGSDLPQTLIWYGCCFSGSFVLYVLNRLHRRQPFSLFQTLNIDVGAKTGKPLVILADMIISSAVGSGVVMIIATPSNAPQALLTGLGMTGILSAAAKD